MLPPATRTGTRPAFWGWGTLHLRRNPALDLKSALRTSGAPADLGEQREAPATERLSLVKLTHSCQFQISIHREEWIGRHFKQQLFDLQLHYNLGQ